MDVYVKGAAVPEWDDLFQGWRSQEIGGEFSFLVGVRNDDNKVYRKLYFSDFESFEDAIEFFDLSGIRAEPDPPRGYSAILRVVDRQALDAMIARRNMLRSTLGG